MRTLILTISLFLFGLSFSQTTFIVKTTDDQPAVGADVYKSGNIIGKTNNEGKYVSNKIEQGDVLEFRLNLESRTYLVPKNSNGEIQQLVLNLDKSNQVIIIENTPTINCPKPIVAEAEQQFIYTAVDEDAVFPGGKKELLSFLAKNLQCPESCIAGKIHLKFTVLKDGTVKDIIVLRGNIDCPECDKEAIRVISIMPKWIPAKVNGKNVNSYFFLPININLR